MRIKNTHTFFSFFLCAFPNHPGYSWFCRGESDFSWQMARLARPLAPSQKNMLASVHLPSWTEWLFVIYVRPGAGTVPVPELGHLTVPVPSLSKFFPVPELGPKIAPSSRTGSCKAPRSGTGCPVPELDNDLCTTSTPISALVPILALVPEWGLCLCPHSGTYGTSACVPVLALVVIEKTKEFLLRMTLQRFAMFVQCMRNAARPIECIHDGESALNRQN